MKFVLPIYIWPIFRLLSDHEEGRRAGGREGPGEVRRKRGAARPADRRQGPADEGERPPPAGAGRGPGGPQPHADGAGAGEGRAREGQNSIFCPLQEKFHTVVLKGVRNISGAH